MGCSPWGCKELGTTELLTLNLLKEAKYLYSKIYKALMKEIRDGNIYRVLGLEESILSKCLYCTQHNLQIQAIPTKLPMAFFTELKHALFIYLNIYLFIYLFGCAES